MNRKLLAILLTLSAVALTACGTDPGTNNGQTGDVKANCGNGKIDANEACDGANLNGKTSCSAVDPTFTSGTLKCSTQCQFDTSGCKKTTENPPPATCDGNAIDAGEECDGTHLPAGKTCSTETSGTKPNGNLKCTACKIDTSDCKEDTPQPTVMKCDEAQKWFGKMGKTGPLVDGEYGAYTNESGIKAAIDAIKAFTDTKVHDVDFTITKAVVVAEDYEGANAYVQDKDGAIYLRDVGQPKGTFKPGQVVSFKITKANKYHDKPQVAGISDLNIEKSEKSKVKAINLNTTELTTLTKANDAFKFVTFQGNLSDKTACDGKKVKYNCYKFTAFDNTSKEVQFRQRADVTWIKEGDCIVFAGPLDYYNTNIQLQTINYDWATTLEK